MTNQSSHGKPDTDVERLIAVCWCGWSSYSHHYNLTYHAEAHNCNSARAMLRRQDKRFDK